MPRFLLTKEEASQAADSNYGPGWWQNTDEKRLNQVAQAQLRKVAAYVKRHAIMIHTKTINRYVLYLGAEEWDALMHEAGLDETEAPDAKA